MGVQNSIHGQSVSSCWDVQAVVWLNLWKLAVTDSFSDYNSSVLVLSHCSLSAYNLFKIWTTVFRAAKRNSAVIFKAFPHERHFLHCLMLFSPISDWHDIQQSADNNCINTIIFPTECCLLLRICHIMELTCLCMEKNLIAWPEIFFTNPIKVSHRCLWTLSLS